MATRETRDGEPGPRTGARILDLETLPAGDGDFTAPNRNTLDQVAIRKGREPIALDKASEVLGRRPLRLNSEFEGLPLARVERTTSALGRHSKTLLTGQAAADAKACRNHVRQTGARSGPACDRMRQRGQSLEIRGDRVYALGPVTWDEQHDGVALFYGTIGDDPSTQRSDAVPLWDGPFVSVEQATRRGRAFGLPGRGYIPPEGSVLLSGRFASLVKDGVYVSIQASSEQLALSAARAIERLPG